MATSITTGDTRITEAGFRAAAPQSIAGIDIVEITRFHGGSFNHHTYPTAAALTRRGNTFSTHTLIYRDDRDDFLLETGHYDFPTRTAAEHDARHRTLA